VWDWASDHVEAIITGVVSILVGFVGAARLFFGLKAEVEAIREQVDSHQETLAEMSKENSAAKAQRDHIEKNTDLILQHVLNEKK